MTFFVQEPGIISTHERLASLVMMLAELKLCYAHRKASKSVVEGLSALQFPPSLADLDVRRPETLTITIHRRK